MKKVVIIGASDTGITAALRIRELNKNLRPLVIADNNYPNYSICGIPFYLGGRVEKWQNLAHRTREDLEEAGFDLRLDTRATGIAPEQKLVTVNPNDGEKKKITYDELVLATGARSAVPPIEGIHLPGVFTLRWMDDCLEFEYFLTEEDVEKALIIGGGYVGLEMAEALTNRGLAVTLVEFEDTILNTVAPELRRLVQEKLEAEGIQVVTGTAVEKIAENGGSLRISGSGGFRDEADTVLVSTGAEPATELGREIGIETGKSGAYRVNKRMETSISHIYAGGDCVKTPHLLTGEDTHFAIGTVAHRHGRVIGSNICGYEEEYEGALGTQSLKLFDLVVARTGLTAEEAGEAGYSSVEVEVEVPDHKSYYPPSYDLRVRVVADRETEKLLGAQIAGSVEAEVSKRIDIFATALAAGMYMGSFNRLDLSYTPPLSSPFDPV
ncbi:MAG: FAD-dependent oxidoreductase, partial [Halanaerobiaceae bacterium]